MQTDEITYGNAGSRNQRARDRRHPERPATDAWQRSSRSRHGGATKAKVRDWESRRKFEREMERLKGAEKS
jgi:hypothetical protein